MDATGRGAGIAAGDPAFQGGERGARSGFRECL